MPKTILRGGLTYALVNRFRKALPESALQNYSQGESMVMVDGRGISHNVYKNIINEAKKIGTRNIVTSTSDSLSRRLEWVDGKLILHNKGARKSESS